MVAKLPMVGHIFIIFLSIIGSDVKMMNSFRLRLLKNNGYTVRDFLIGIILIGLFAALIGPKIVGRSGESRQAVAKQQIEGFSSALKMYKDDTTKYPTQEQGLDALVTQPQGLDNWKQARKGSRHERGHTLICD